MTMNCPSCRNLLTQTDIDDVSLYRCIDSCKGIWIERNEFKKLKEPTQEQVDYLSDLICNNEVVPDLSEQRYCPKCDEKVLSSRFHKQIELDQCELCWGTWFDCGEILVIVNEKVNQEVNIRGNNQNSNTSMNKEQAESFAKTLSSYAKKIEEKIKEEEKKIANQTTLASIKIL